MKIFVSGQITDLENVRSVQNRIISEGHDITHDWTRNETGEKMLAGDEAKLSNLVETGRRADLDIQGVVTADVYVACTDNKKPGKGMYVELGAALALNSVNNTPRVCIIGALNHMSIFYFHPAVERFSTVDEFIKSLS